MTPQQMRDDFINSIQRVDGIFNLIQGKIPYVELASEIYSSHVRKFKEFSSQINRLKATIDKDAQTFTYPKCIEYMSILMRIRDYSTDLLIDLFNVEQLLSKEL